MKIPTRTLVLTYAVALLGFLALDTVWLSTASARLYQPAIGALMAAQVNWLAVALFYPLYMVGLVYFAIVPGLQAGRVGVAALRGLLLGLLTYATYDFTNQATLKDWPWHITLIDIVWGGCINSAAAALGGWAGLKLAPRPTSRP